MEVAPALGIPIADLSGLDVTREVIFPRLLHSVASHPQPTVLVGEDAHWADEATLNLIRYLGRRIGGVRAFVIVTYRDDGLGAEHPLRVVMGDLASVTWVRRMTLRPLSRSAVRQVAHGHPSDPDRLYELTAGNPFFVTEVLFSEGSPLPSASATPSSAAQRDCRPKPVECWTQRL
jgi:predicted ATPase